MTTAKEILADPCNVWKCPMAMMTGMFCFPECQDSYEKADKTESVRPAGRTAEMPVDEGTANQTQTES